MPTCPQCGAELSADDPAGLCPQCLFLGVFESSLSEVDTNRAAEEATVRPASSDDFGLYHILRPLGEGGRGTVYLAEQREPIRRQVVLKVVKLGMDTNQVLARFANERQTLALMDHPNIACIFDAGATPNGRPYFVMEYIDGVPITQYCDSHRIAVRQRLELFLTAWRAVQHAHRRGVIHRDLKPSNVLVKEQDGLPVPKVIDFGIAKATEQRGVENTLLTQFGQMIGTPEYASPEQAEPAAGPADETSDVYSLGVLLYELLIGTVPFDLAARRGAGFAEVVRIIREEDAPSLTRKLSAMSAEKTAQVAALRQTDPKSLRRLVDGDLSRITLKTLEKMRARRYASVADLISDVQRYIEDRPVLASPPSVAYRMNKFVRRHRTAIVSTVVGFAFFTLGTFTLWPLMHRNSSAATTLLRNKGAIVVAGFINNTADKAFEGTLRATLTEALEKSRYFSVLSDAHIGQELRLMVRAPDTKLTPEVAAEICERTGSAAVVEGSLASLGNRYALNLRARNCQTGDTLNAEEATAASKEDIPNTLRELAYRFRNTVGESLPTANKEPSLPTEVTTPSLEAWKCFSAASKAEQNKAQAAEAVTFLKQAVELDPKFAMAYATLGRNSADLGENEIGVRNIAKAYELRDRVSDQENYFITFNYHRQVTGNLELARQTLESWVQKYPRDLHAHGLLSGLTSLGTGHYETAVKEGLKAIEIDPDFAVGYEDVAFAEVYLNRPAEAAALLRKASVRKIEAFQFSLCRYVIAFLKGDQAAMEKEVAARHAGSEAQGLFNYQEAMTFAHRGQLKEANRPQRAPWRWLVRAVYRNWPVRLKVRAPCGMRSTDFPRMHE